MPNLPQCNLGYTRSVCANRALIAVIAAITLLQPVQTQAAQPPIRPPFPPPLVDHGRGLPPQEFRGSPDLSARSFPGNSAYEPTVAAHPFDPNTIALLYQGHESFMHCGIGSVIRISHDGGATWTTSASQPAGQSGRGQNFHATLTWGPGPTPGSARLYWIDTTVPGCDYSQHSVTIAWSDDEGETWSTPYVERRTAPWLGGMPQIVTDNSPSSPGYGRVFAIYNYLDPGGHGAAIGVLASSDFGATWRAAAPVPAAPRERGCDYSWRIGSRGAVGPDGTLYASSFQADLRNWNTAKPFLRGGAGNVCRIGFTVTALHLNENGDELTVGTTHRAIDASRSALSLSGGAWQPGTPGVIVDPAWAFGIGVDPTSGALLLAVGDQRANPQVTEGRGVVKVGRSVDGGATWLWQTLPSIRLTGDAQDGAGIATSFRPTIAMCANGGAAIGMRVITDADRIRSGRPTIRVAAFMTLSTDHGVTWTRPFEVSQLRYNPDVLGVTQDGPGLHDAASCLADGRVAYAYGDARDGSPSGEGRGKMSVYLTVVDPGYRRSANLPRYY